MRQRHGASIKSSDRRREEHPHSVLGCGGRTSWVGTAAGSQAGPARSLRSPAGSNTPGTRGHHAMSVCPHGGGVGGRHGPITGESFAGSRPRGSGGQWGNELRSQRSRRPAAGWLTERRPPPPARRPEAALSRFRSDKLSPARPESPAPSGQRVEEGPLAKCSPSPLSHGLPRRCQGRAGPDRTGADGV